MARIASVASGPSSRISIAFMEEYISTYGIPEKIVTDQGTAFTGKRFRQFCGRYNIDLEFGTQDLHTRKDF